MVDGFSTFLILLKTISNFILTFPERFSVCKMTKGKALATNNQQPPDSVILCTLLHDISKALKPYYDKDGNLRHRNTYIPGHGKRSVNSFR